MSPLLIIAGFSIGVLVGLTGVGGGSLMTPLLVFMGLNPLVAVGTDLLYSLPTKMFGWYLHRKQGTLRLDVVKQLCMGGVPAACVGLGLLYFESRFVDHKVLETWIRHAIGVAVCFSAVMILLSPLILRRRKEADAQVPMTERAKNLRLNGIGAFVGFIVSLTSIGGGSVALPLLVLLLPNVALAELVGSDIAFAAILVFFASLGHWGLGHIDVGVTINLLLGSLIGVYVGSKLCAIMQQQWLRPALAVVLIFAGSRFLV